MRSFTHKIVKVRAIANKSLVFLRLFSTIFAVEGYNITAKCRFFQRTFCIIQVSSFYFHRCRIAFSKSHLCCHTGRVEMSKCFSFDITITIIISLSYNAQQVLSQNPFGPTRRDVRLRVICIIVYQWVFAYKSLNLLSATLPPRPSVLITLSQGTFVPDRECRHRRRPQQLLMITIMLYCLHDTITTIQGITCI